MGQSTHALAYDTPKDFENEPSLDNKIIADLKQLDSEDGGGLFIELTELYLEETPLLIYDLKNAGRLDDKNILMRFAHKLKGMSANLGATKLVKICALIESLSRAGKRDGVDSLILEAENEHQKVMELLRQQ